MYDAYRVLDRCILNICVCTRLTWPFIELIFITTPRNTQKLRKKVRVPKKVTLQKLICFFSPKN